MEKEVTYVNEEIFHRFLEVRITSKKALHYGELVRRLILINRTTFTEHAAAKGKAMLKVSKEFQADGFFADIIGLVPISTLQLLNGQIDKRSSTAPCSGFLSFSHGFICGHEGKELREKGFVLHPDHPHIALHMPFFQLVPNILGHPGLETECARGKDNVKKVVPLLTALSPSSFVQPDVGNVLCDFKDSVFVIFYPFGNPDQTIKSIGKQKCRSASDSQKGKSISTSSPSTLHPHAF